MTYSNAGPPVPARPSCCLHGLPAPSAPQTAQAASSAGVAYRLNPLRHAGAESDATTLRDIVKDAALLVRQCRSVRARRPTSPWLLWRLGRAGAAASRSANGAPPRHAPRPWPKYTPQVRNQRLVPLNPL